MLTHGLGFFFISTVPALVNKLETKKVFSVALGVLDYNTFPVTNETGSWSSPAGA